MPKLLLLMSFMTFGSYVAYEVWQRMASCVPDVRADLLSPNGLRRAVLYGMDCRATSGFDTYVVLVPTGADVRAERHPPVLVLDGDHSVDLTWQSDRKLVIGMPLGNPTVEQQADNSGPVEIIYERMGTMQ